MIEYSDILLLAAAACAVGFGWSAGRALVSTAVFCINVWLERRRERKMAAAAPPGRGQPVPGQGCPPPGGKCGCLIGEPEAKPPGQYA